MTTEVSAVSRGSRRHPAAIGPRRGATGGFPLRVFPGGHFSPGTQRDTPIRELAGRITLASS